MTRWCRYDQGSGPSYGVVEDDMVVGMDGSPFAGASKSGTAVPLSTVKILTPVLPGTFFCVGVNYRDHIVRMSAKRGVEPVFPARPEIGYRANSALCAHDDQIIKPADSGANFQYEGELVAVFGRSARNVGLDEALDCVFGWTIGNDISERDWQKSDRTLWRAKNCDTFKPMGPWITTSADLSAMRTTISVNGLQVEDFKTNDMLFSVAEYIVEITRYITIQPGDVMWMGTDGVPGNLKDGDVVEVSITGLGTLRNRVRQQ